jgi:AcrR family transcriptional regulator
MTVARARGQLTPEQILDATEDVLRRFGPAKATVADVARALDMSPGSIYRHFPSKAALHEAVTRDWLQRVHSGLDEIAVRDLPAPERFQLWLKALFTAKRRYAGEDPELFATYTALVVEFSEAGVDHVDELIAQLALIIRSGVQKGEMSSLDPDRAAQTVFAATAQFHNPMHAGEWHRPDAEEILDDVIELLLSGVGDLARVA